MGSSPFGGPFQSKSKPKINRSNLFHVTEEVHNMDSKNGRWPSMMISFFIVVIVILSTSRLAFSDDSTKLHGIWKLVSFVQEIQETGERRLLFGKNPTGYVIFAPEGRFMTCIEAEGRRLRRLMRIVHPQNHVCVHRSLSH